MRYLARALSEDLADAEPGRDRAHQQSGIDRRREQGELALDPFDVLTVSDLVEPVRDRIPVADQLLVARDTEVRHPRQAPGWQRGHGRLGELRREWLRRENILQLHEAVPKRIDSRTANDGFQLPIRAAAKIAGRFHDPRLGPEEAFGRDIELQCRVYRLTGKLAEQEVSPLDERIEVAHERGLLKSHSASTRDAVGNERVLPPFVDFVLPLA